MSASKTSQRIERKQTPPAYYVAHRNYWKFLVLDFAGRCGYSDQHMTRAGGKGGMDVDHHNPLLKPPHRNNYTNLLLSTRHCNGKKGKRWPTPEQKKLGLRFLNPCEEQDYGTHIFEDPTTFELWGETPAGCYHTRYLDLNAVHLMRERRRRHELRVLKKTPCLVTPKKLDGEVRAGLAAFNEELELMIRPIPQKTKPPLTLN